LVNLGYDFFFRDISQFQPSQIINVATIIFGTMLLFVFAGVAYFFADKLKNGMTIYIVVFALLTVLCFSWGLHVTRSADLKVTANFRILLSGIIGISGLLSTFFVPYLMKHQSIYLD
jgi:hypothetical protein